MNLVVNDVSLPVIGEASMVWFCTYLQTASNCLASNCAIILHNQPKQTGAQRKSLHKDRGFLGISIVLEEETPYSQEEQHPAKFLQRQVFGGLRFLKGAQFCLC